MTCLCPWCARTEAYRKLRGPVEYIRTINYNSRTAATKNAVEVAEAKYDREMAVLGKMRLRQPERWERVDGVVGREKVKGGSPLRRELKAEDLEDDVGVDGDCESEDEGPSPSLMGYEPDDEDEISDVEDEDPMDSLAGKLDELTFDEKEDSPVSSAAPKEVDEPSQDSLESGAQPLCSCRSGYLCEYC
ncbi:hypothetical protein CLAFUW4_08889 [Fulvia fulva]|nr:hypothetical protein CLAFUR4_08895 [Fulvia fulva]KAK4614946.1 hypothetical protein CLAFUR0_08887 [Fulvia fulva]WPV20552.1 hypothetical protein CLAFUW4_08889 [Fulvia fulva]WPV35319.1 hypothetical protein CLAFUW7_08890 [Fulvia fulva]